jgi:peroxiredoxin
LPASSGAGGSNTVAAPNLLSPNLKATDPDNAWSELSDANHMAPEPAAWHDHPPTAAEAHKYYLPFAMAMADKARDFYTRFPTNGHALDAKLMEFQVLATWDATNHQARLESAGDSLIADPAVTGENHTMIMWIVAQNVPSEKALPLLSEIAKSDAPDKLKAEAQQLLGNFGYVGKPIDIQFRAVDGRQVDLAKLKGKVVLIDFWATWCPPCVEEVPDVKAAYDQFHTNGFEIIGISGDDEKDRLTRFVAAHQMEWPQFLDGVAHKYATEFGVSIIPTMWLIDKKGIVRDVQAGKDLGGGVQKLLAE